MILSSTHRRLRVLVLLEATRLNGPALNLLYALEHIGDVAIAFVVFNRGGEDKTEYQRALESAGYEVISIPEQFRWDPRAAFALFRSIRRWNPDVLQIHNTKSRLFALVGRLFRFTNRAPVIACFHGETSVSRLQLAYNMLDRLLFIFAERVLIVDASQRDMLKRWGVSPPKIRLVPNAIPIHDSAGVTWTYPLTIVCAARLSWEKGVDVLLRAAALAQVESPGTFSYQIFGEGPERDRLEHLSRELGLERLVQFKGHVSNPKMIYENAHMVVIPSRSEGMPNVLLEAFARGIPVIATAVGGIPGVLQDGVSGILVPPENASLLAGALSRASGQEALMSRMAESAQTAVRMERCPQKKADLLKSLWFEVVAGASKH